MGIEDKEGAQEPSIEDLKAVQETQEAKIQRQKEEQVAEEQRKAELQVQAAEGYQERQELLNKGFDLQALQDEMEAAEIKERTARAEELKASEAAKGAEMDATTVNLEMVKERLDEIRRLVQGKPAEEIASEVNQALERAVEQERQLRGQVEAMTTEINKLRAEQVSEEEVGRYQKLLEEIAELNYQVAEIEANPVLVERLMSEAKTEDTLRQRVVYEALMLVDSRSQRLPKEARNLLADVVQSFLADELKSQGLDQVEPDTRLGKLQVFSQHLIEGMRTRDADRIAHSQDPLKNKQDKFAGLLLGNLVGGFGHIGSIQTWLMLRIAGVFSRQPSREESAEIQKQGIGRYLGTLNKLRAYTWGTPDKFLGYHTSQVEWRHHFDDKLYGIGYEADDGGPIRSKDATAGEKARIQKEFGQDIKIAKRASAEFEEREQKAREAEIAELEAKIQQLEANLEESQVAEDLIGNYRDYAEGETAMSRQKYEVDGLTNQLQGARSELERTGFLGFGRKRELRGEISRLEKQLQSAGAEIGGIRDRREKYEQARTTMGKLGAPIEIRRELEQLRSRLERRRQGY